MSGKRYKTAGKCHVGCYMIRAGCRWGLC